MFELTVTFGKICRGGILGDAFTGHIFYEISNNKTDICHIFSDFECKEGMLNIKVRVGGQLKSVECDKPGQNISIAAADNSGYVHQGSIQV